MHHPSQHSGVASPKIWRRPNVWFQTNNTILFRKTALKAQNDYFLKILGGMAPLAPPGYAYVSTVLESRRFVEEMTTNQHPGNIVWLARPVRAISPWATWRSSFQLIARLPPRVALYAVPFRLPRYVAGATWSLHLCVADGGDCREFFERASLLKAREARSLTRSTTDVQWVLIVFPHFMV